MIVWLATLSNAALGAPKGLLNGTIVAPNERSHAIIDITKLTSSGAGAVQSHRDFQRKIELTSPSWVHRHSANNGDAVVSVFEPKVFGTKHGGTIQQLEVHPSTGEVKRVAFEIPATEHRPASIKIGESYADLIDGRKSPVISVKRSFETPTGNAELYQSFTTVEKNGKLLRVLGHSTLTTADAQILVTRPERDQMRLLNVVVSKRGADKVSSLFALPDNVPGDIVGFQISSSGSRLTVFTSEGKELAFAVSPDQNAAGKTLWFKLIDEKAFDVRSTIAASKTYQGRKASGAGEGPRGLQVKQDGQS